MHQHKVLCNGQIFDQRYFLKRRTNPQAIRELRRKANHRFAENCRRAGVRPHNTTKNLNDGRFAGAVFTEQCMRLSAAHFEIDRIKSDRRPVVHAQAADGYGRLHSPS